MLAHVGKGTADDAAHVLVELVIPIHAVKAVFVCAIGAIAVACIWLTLADKLSSSTENFCHAAELSPSGIASVSCLAPSV